ncbi:MAG: tetratricopeptide repeat protein [Thermodesulfobacteriota bacterium]
MTDHKNEHEHGDEVPEIDAFTIYLQKVIDYVKENKKYFIAGVLVFFVALAAVSYIPVSMEKKESKAFVELEKGLRDLSASENVTSSEIEKEFASLKSEYSGTNAAGLADLYAARMLYDNKDMEKAAQYYNSAAQTLEGRDLFEDLTDYELGCLYFDTDIEKSESFFQKIASEDSFLKEDALFYLGIAGDKDSLEKLNKEYPEGFYTQLTAEKLAGVKLD